MVKLGVIGCGVIGTQHITNIIDSPETELVAVSDLVDRTWRSSVREARYLAFGKGMLIIRCAS